MTGAARIRILDAAERLFAQHGFDATATSRIATAAAVPKGLLFYYFPTKSELLRTLVAERLHFGPIDTLAVVEPGDPVRSLLKLTVKLYDVQRASDVLRVIIWREQHTHPEVAIHLAAHRRQIEAVVEKVLQASIVRPLAAIRLSAAARAWVAILTAQPIPASAADSIEVDSNDLGARDNDPVVAEPTDLPAIAALICDGLTRDQG